jgi:hypothetical protein
MNIYSIKIIPNNPEHAQPIYEVHSWDKAEQIIQSTREIYDEAFTFEVIGNVSAKVAR